MECSCSLTYIFTLIGMVSILTYIIPIVLLNLLGDINLKKKYGAEWAIVTGASSGIGKAIVEKLASQETNVVCLVFANLSGVSLLSIRCL